MFLQCGAALFHLVSEESHLRNLVANALVPEVFGQSFFCTGLPLSSVLFNQVFRVFLVVEFILQDSKRGVP